MPEDIQTQPTAVAAEAAPVVESTTVETVDTSSADQPSSNFTRADFEAAAAELEAEANTTSSETANTLVVADGTANTAVANTVDPEEAWDRKDGPEPSRYKKSLENARVKERERVTQEFDQKFGWAKDITAEDGAAVAEWIKIGNENPLAAADTLTRALASDKPVEVAETVIKAIVESNKDAVPQLRQWMLGVLGVTEEQLAGVQTAAGTTTTTPEGMPQPPQATVFTDTGEPVYTAKQQQDYIQKLLAWQSAQFQKELSPIKKDRETAAAQKERDAQERLQTQAKQKFDTELASVDQEMSKLPGYDDESKKAMGKYVLENFSAQDITRLGPRAIYHQAYLAVVAPSIETAATKKAVADIRKKAGAGTLSPNLGTTSAPLDPSKATFSDIYKELEREQSQQ